MHKIDTMLKKQAFLFSVLLLVIVVGCARRGTITGGVKDSIPPIMLSSLPKNYSTNFTGNEIILNFDEYVKTKNLDKQLIITPLLKYRPEILPYYASKTLKIRIKDTLQPNTTYSFNFGSSIEDNNENNAMKQFKYVFSTGNEIDSLKLKVKIKDALETKQLQYVSIMLYDMDADFNDSTIFKKTPRYVASSLDSLITVNLENIKAGKYKLIALKDENNNNKFDPKKDKIGFRSEPITLPNDNTYTLDLFKEELAFKALNLSQVAGAQFALAYQGNPENTKVEVTRQGTKIPSVVTKIQTKDSLQVWVRASKGDSLQFQISNGKFSKKYNQKLKDFKRDTLNIKSESGNLKPNAHFILNSATPLVKTDKSKIKILRKDSTAVAFSTQYDDWKQQLALVFNKDEKQSYIIHLEADALTDFYDKTNKALKYTVTTGAFSDYGNLRVTLENAKRFPVIVELTSKDGKVLETAYNDGSKIVTFENIQPNKYTMRLIYDDNKNRRWDPGNYLENRQSEEVIYFPKELDVRGNWDVEQPFDLKISN